MLRRLGTQGQASPTSSRQQDADYFTGTRKIHSANAQPYHCKRDAPRLASYAAGLLLTGCAGEQSALMPAGPAADAIAQVGWIMFWGSGVVLAIVMALALRAVFRKSPGKRRIADDHLVLVGGFLWPVVTLSLLLVYGLYQMRDLRAGATPDPLQIEVVGHQWWWQVRYPAAAGRPGFLTANEIHIPVDTPVTLVLRSADVIHSFWVPRLAGKLDLIPGRANQLRIQAGAPGRYRGQCAEFCGAQHARMAFWVVAETPDEFDAWRARQGEPAAQPEGGPAIRGPGAFVAHCLRCHSIRGLGDGGRIGPDLTHLGSRSHIAAGTLENNADNLRRFITESQRVKPGSGMPEFGQLDPATLDALVAYLQGLR